MYLFIDRSSTSEILPLELKTSDQVLSELTRQR